MGFIVIEGLDGSGKSTQVNMLLEYLMKKEIKHRYIHFPRLEKGIYGQMIARFLRGEFGKLEDVHPYLVSLIYAGDRKEIAQKMYQWLDENNLLIVDRYVCSNIAYQGAKLQTDEEKEELADWIMNFEYEYHKIPKPDINIFLDVPFDFTRKKLGEVRTGDDRDYLKGKKDIHEANFDFQKKVKEMYLWQAGNYADFEIINCKGNDNEMLSPQQIFDNIIKTINFIPELNKS